LENEKKNVRFPNIKFFIKNKIQKRKLSRERMNSSLKDEIGWRVIVQSYYII
jgi:ppGpp synthetase/RelA/SpoT-type nucleotidyltranferase